MCFRKVTSAFIQYSTMQCYLGLTIQFRGDQYRVENFVKSETSRAYFHNSVNNLTAGLVSLRWSDCAKLG